MITAENKTESIPFCVIIPTYNNEKTLQRVIEGVLAQSKDVIVVNDGSTDGTSAILDTFSDRITRTDFPKNKGKGKALREGFKLAVKKDFKHAITIDSDGQHFPDDIPLFIEKLKEHPTAVIMGSRNMSQEGVPSKSSFGNKFSNFWFWIETGIKLPDTQTGFRLYPLSKIKKLHLFTNKFELEIEVIVKLAWRNVPFIALPIRVKYDAEERVSHFRPFKDFTRISFLNSYLVILALIFRPILLIRKMFTKAFWTEFKTAVFNPKESVAKKSFAVGLGLFMGIFPLWGFQMAVALVISIFFKLNKFIVLATSNISIPPMIPFIIYGSYLFGGVFMSQPLDFSMSDGITLQDMYLNFEQYLIGSIALSFVAGILGFFITYFLLSLKRSKKHID